MFFFKYFLGMIGFVSYVTFGLWLVQIFVLPSQPVAEFCSIPESFQMSFGIRIATILPIPIETKNFPILCHLHETSNEEFDRFFKRMAQELKAQIILF
jgi:hypothetical protein